MKKPYLKKYGTIAGFTIWIVDGNYIRRTIDEEFTNFDHHHYVHFIPKNEFWIDQGYGRGEEKYYIEHMLVEYWLIRDGRSHLEASKKAELIERRERSKSIMLKKIIKKKMHRKEIIRKIHKTLLKKYSKILNVWIVNGDLVRDLFFINFTEGGHDKVYPFIPENEIWIDDEVIPKERKFILLHEIHERNLMLQGWSYDLPKKKVHGKKSLKSAHFSASELEYFCRHHPHQTDKKIKEEFEKLSSLLVVSPK